VRVAQITRSGTMIPIHWGTFELGDDGESESVDTLEAAVAAVPAWCRPRVVVLRNGEHAEIAPLGGDADSLPSSRCGRRR
jgi:hypothetical protein